mgnify:CR=1 FL=1
MITSTANAKVKHLANLRKKRKLRDEEGVFLVEGIRMFRETPKRLLKEVYASESFYKKEKHMTDEALKGSGAHLLILSDTVFSYVSDTKTPQGILCVVRQLDYSLEEAAAGRAAHMIVLNRLQDPGTAHGGGRRSDGNPAGSGMRGYLQSEDHPLYHGIHLPDAVLLFAGFEEGYRMSEG